jgi:hypothetical protein
MSAHIGKGAHLPIAVAQYQHGFVTDIERGEAAGLGQLGGMEREQPMSVPDRPHLGIGDARVEIEPVVERPSGPLAGGKFGK